MLLDSTHLGGTIAAASAVAALIVAALGLVLKLRQQPQLTESANVGQLASIIDAMQKLADELRKELERSQNLVASVRAEALEKATQLESLIIALRATIARLQEEAK